MADAAILDAECFQTTDGEIAIINLNSARQRSWGRFNQDPLRPGDRRDRARKRTD